MGLCLVIYPPNSLCGPIWLHHKYVGFIESDGILYLLYQLRKIFTYVTAFHFFPSQLPVSRVPPPPPLPQRRYLFRYSAVEFFLSLMKYTGWSKSLCEPDDYNTESYTRLSCLTIWLNLTAWQPTARGRGSLGPHQRHLLFLILITFSW
jgi:hypothetical protein